MNYSTKQKKAATRVVTITRCCLWGLLWVRRLADLKLRSRFQCFWDMSPSTGFSRRLTQPSGSPSPDRKSTRLNSSHMSISYAVFCLQKKTTPKDSNPQPKQPKWHEFHTNRNIYA